MGNSFKTGRHVSLLAATILLALGTASATPIVGTLQVGGSAEVTQTTIDFSPFIVGVTLDGTGELVTVGPGSGVFSPLLFGDLGTIVDRSADAGVVPAQPAGVSIDVMNWMTFTSPSFRYALDLKFIDVGTYSSADCGAVAASGQTCTPSAPFPYTSPYNLSNFVDSSAGLSSNTTFSVRGVLRNLDTGLIDYNFNGVFGAEFLGQPYQEVLAIVNSGGSVSASYSGTINATSAVPEPSVGFLTGMGLVCVALGLFSKRRKTAAA